MDAAVAGLLGVGIGSISGLLGTLLTYWLGVHDEVRQARAARTKEVQATLATFSAQAASGMVSMEWITWMAAYDSEKLSLAAFQKYNDEMRAFIPGFVSAYTALAALDREIADRMSPFVQGVFALDAQIARCEPAFRHSSAEGTTQLAAHDSRANALFGELFSLAREMHVGPTSRRPHASEPARS